MVQISQQTKEDIRNAYDLYKTFEKNEKSIKGGKFTSLFLAHVGKGNDFEFVRKNSFVGICRRFWAWITRADTFNFDTNFKLVDKLYQKIYSECNIEDISQLDELAQEFGIKPTDKKSAGQILRENLLQVGYFLNNVESHRFTKKTEGKPYDTVATFARHSIPLYEKRVQGAYDTFSSQHKAHHQGLYIAINGAFNTCNLTADEKDAMVFAIVTSGDMGAVIDGLGKNDHSYALTVVREALSSPIAHQTKAAIRTLLDKVAAPAAMCNEAVNVPPGLEPIQGYLLTHFQNHLNMSDEEYDVVASTVQRLKREFEGIKETLPQDSESRRSIALYADMFDRMDQKLTTKQKEIAEKTLPTNIGKIEKSITAQPKGKEIAVGKDVVQKKSYNPISVSAQTLDLVSKIEKHPLRASLAAVAALKPESDDYLYLCEQFFKKAGTVEELSKFGPDAFKDLQALSNGLQAHINVKSAGNDTPERFGLFLLTTYALESSFKKMKPEDRLLADSVPSVLASSYIYEHVKKLRTSDPFWTAAFNDIMLMRERLPEADKAIATELFNIKLDASHTMKDNDYLAGEISKWLRTNAFDMPKKVNASIAKDRAAQKVRIAEEIAAEKIKLAGNEKSKLAAIAERDKQQASKTAFEQKRKSYGEDPKQLQKALDDLKRQKDVLDGKFDALDQQAAVGVGKRTRKQVKNRDEARKELLKEESETRARLDEILSLDSNIRACAEAIARLEAEIKNLDIEIAKSKDRIDHGIENDVHADPQYWPWGIATNDIDSKGVKSAWNDQQLAKYFFGEHDFFQKKMGVQDPLPAGFRAYQDIVIPAKNVFDKKDDKVCGHIQVRLKDGELHVEPTGVAYAKAAKISDIYDQSLQETSYRELYNYLYHVDDIPEVKIPYAATEGVQAAFAQNRPSLKQQVQEAETYVEKATTIVAGLWSKAKETGSKIVGGVSHLVRNATVEMHEELRELCQLHCSKDLQIDSTISYFQENPRRLFDRDGRLLFHALLFESDLLAKQCANEATRELTVERLRSLFDAVYTNARKEDPKTCADVLWLAANVQRYLKVDTLVDQKFLTTLVEDLVKSQNKQAWPEVFEALLAASGQLFTGNLPQEDKLFVYGLLLRAMRKDHAIDADVTPNLLRIKHADMAEEALKMRLATVSEADLLKMINEHAPAFLKEMYPILATAQFSPVANKAAVFETKDKKTTLSLSDGMFISTDPEIYRDHKDPVPQEVMNLMVEQKLYGSVADMQLLRCNRAGSVYTITDPNRDMSFKVDLKKRDVFVMTKDLPWSHHIVKDEERAKFTNRELASCFQWYDAKAQKTFLVDPKSLKPLYELQQDGTVVATGSANTLAQTPAKSIFSGFEDPASSIYWTDKSGSLQSIDFPRLGIGFTRNQKNEFCVKGAEKWLLSDNQSVPGFINSTGLLVVENSDTKERKLLMPVWDIQAGGAFDFSVGQERTHYLECPIIHGELKPKSTEVRYYLAKLYLARGNVEAAETLLYAREAYVTSKKLDPQLTEFLRDIANMPLAGASSRVLKLQMQALYLLQKNDEQFPKEALKEEPIKAKDPLAREVILQEMELALAYLSRVPDEKRLSAAKELFVLDKVMLDYENAKYAEDKDPQLDKLIIDIREAVEQIRSLEHKTEVTNRHEFTEALAALEPLSKLNTLVEDRGLMRHIRRDYFEKLQKPAVEPVSKTLFSANAVELAADDEAGKSKFKSLMDDIEIAEKSTGGVSYTITGNQEELFSKLEAEEAKERKLLAHVETLIVNNVIQTLSKDPEVAKAFQTRERFYPTIEELAFLVSRRDYHDFAKKHYPQLSAGDREALQEAIKKYFFQKETWQQLKRAVNRVEELKAATPELAPTIMDNLGSELDRTRAYPPDHPYAMIFLFIETTANIKLRPEQVQNILKLAEAIREDKNLVFQMIMGAGKTAVIQPLLAILLADSNSLSTVMVPEAQFAKVRSKLAETLGNVAEKMLVTFPYDIELSQDTAYVDQVLARLKTAKEDGAVVLLASRQKHSILTSMYEAYYSLSRLPERIKNKKNEILNADDPAIERKLNEELKVLEDDKTKKALEAHVNSISALCDFLQLEESAQIDEIDMIMNPKVIFKRPIGERVIFDKDTGFQRSRLLTDLLLDLATNEKLNNEVSIDFANAMRSPPGTFVKQPASYEINEQLYYEKVQPFLVQRALVRLKNNPQLKDLIEKHGDVIGRFLTQEATEDERKWVGSHVTDKMAQELLGAAAHAITNVLKTSLLRECKSNYGKDPMLDLADPNLRKYIARPYAAPGKPKPTVYADPHEKIIYSVQYYLYNGIPEQDAKDMLIEWQQLAKKEMRGRSFEDTKWAARLEELRLRVPSSDDFFADPKSKEFKALLEWFQKAISKDPQSIMDFCQKRLFNQNAIHAESVTSTPQTLAGSSKKVFGYTGTLHQAILATFMDVVPEPGTDGKTIAAMEAKFRANAASVDTMARDANLVNEAINQFKDPDYNVFIDSGNWLKDVEITKFAADVLEQCGRKEIEGVVFHDSDGNEVCLERDELGKTKIVLFEQSRLKESPEKRLTVILSRFETGTDIPQRPTAKAFMSIRKGMTLRDALQSAFRMRGILSGQSVTIKVSDEVKSDIAQNLWDGIENHPEANKELSQAVRNALAGDKDDFIAMLKPDSETVWRYLAANLIHEEQDKNWAAARYKMRETFEVSARAALTSKAPLQDRMELFNKISSLLVQHENPSRFRALVDGQKDKTADEAIADAMQPFLKIAANVRAMRNISADLRSAFEEKNLKAALEACVDKTQLAKVISGRGVDAGAEMEAEAEAEVEQEQEQEQVAEMQQEQQQEAEVQVENVPPPAEPNYQPIAKEHPSTANGYSIDDIFDKQFAHFNNALPQGLVGLPGADAIEYTDNFIIKRAGKGDLTSKVDLTSAEYAANRLAARYMLVLKENNKTRYVILSHEDAVRVKRGMLAGPVKNGRVAMLTDLNGKVVSQSQRGSMQEFDAEQLAEKRLLAKFLTVKPIISSRDVDRFKAIVERAPESHKLLDECRKYYEKAVSYLPTTCEEYNGSYLGRVLNNI